MEDELVKKEENEVKKIKWTSMFALSAGFHIAIFILVMIIPDTISARRNFEGRIYQVDLVEIPAGAAASSPEIIGPTVKKASLSSVSDDTQTKRIYVPKTEKKPLVIAKRTIKPKIKKKKEPEISASQLIDRKISEIKKKMASEKDAQLEDNHLAESLAKLEKSVSQRTGTPSPGRGSFDGIPMRIYQMEVELWIKDNWSYPVVDRGQKKLEATVLLTVKEDGTIVRSSFKKKSSDAVFDQSVEKAIKKSDPLPRFPEGYRKSEEEFEINFNLKDLEDS